MNVITPTKAPAQTAAELRAIKRTQEIAAHLLHMSPAQEAAAEDSVLDFLDEEDAKAGDKAYASAKQGGLLDLWNDWRAHKREVAEGVHQ